MKKKILNCTRHVVLFLNKNEYKPFYKKIGPISLEQISIDNLEKVLVNFSDMKPPFFEMLSRKDVGVFVMHNEVVVGYMWRKDFDSLKKIKSDGYLPLSGKCSHIHWARVKKDMRGRGLQLLMSTWLVDHAYSLGIEKIYTDVEIENIVSIRGLNKIGFKEIYRIFVLRSKLNWRTITIRY